MVLWNAFPWHPPFQAKKGLLSNRTPTDDELAAGHIILRKMLELGGKFKQVVAVGEKSSSQLLQLGGIPAIKVRHPANGGAGKFRSQMLDLL